MKRVAIVQSNYLPWKGYFDLIASVDEFILLDDVQYTRRDWRNRNQIKTPRGLQWLTVPVHTKGRFTQRICDTQVVKSDWARRHWQAIEANYRRAKHFDRYAPQLASALMTVEHAMLSGLNRMLLENCCEWLGIETCISNSWDYASGVDDRNGRLLEICTQSGADVYVSGPAARDYLDVAAFRDRGLRVEWHGYEGYPEYQQLWGPFQHAVSIIDLLFNCGDQAPRYLLRANR